jgi:transcriptional regulator with GAF, ATPase, and Fis domain
MSLMPHEASTITDVQSVEELRRELAEARQREAAANEVLRVIAGTSDVLKGVVGRSSAGLPEVLNALTEAAVRLCGADKGLIRRRDGNRYVAVSTYGFPDEFGKWVAGTVLESGRDSIVGRAASARQTVHIPDVLAEPEWESGDWQRLADFRSAIAVPLVSGQDILGVLVVHRTEPIAFSEHQIDLVETFADQAVIAIENTRLLKRCRQERAICKRLSIIRPRPVTFSRSSRALRSTCSQCLPPFATLSRNFARPKMLKFSSATAIACALAGSKVL